MNHSGPALRGSFTRLAVDARELRFRFDLQDGVREQQLLARLKSGAIRACSIGFKPEAVSYSGSTLVYSRASLTEISILDGRTPSWFGTWCGAA